MRYTRQYALAVICFMVFGCKPSIPELPLSDDELIGVLMDLHLAEGAMQRIPAQWRDSIGMELRERIAVGYGMSPEELEDVVGLLQLRLEKSTELYDSVIVRLERKQESLGEIKQEQK